MLMCVCVPRLVQYFLSTRTFFFTDNSLLRLCSPCKKEKVSRPFPLDCFLPFPFFRLFTNTLCVLLRMLQTSENHYVNMWKINIYLFAYIFPRYLSNFVGVSVCVWIPLERWYPQAHEHRFRVCLFACRSVCAVHYYTILYSVCAVKQRQNNLS